MIHSDSNGNVWQAVTRNLADNDRRFAIHVRIMVSPENLVTEEELLPILNQAVESVRLVANATFEDPGDGPAPR